MRGCRPAFVESMATSGRPDAAVVVVVHVDEDHSVPGGDGTLRPGGAGAGESTAVAGGDGVLRLVAGRRCPSDRC